MVKKLFCLIIILMLSTFVFADIDISDIQDYQQMSKQEINQFIKQNLDEVDLSQAPGVLKFVLGKPKINTVIEMNNDEIYTFGFLVADDEITDFIEEGHEEPNYTVTITENTLIWIANSEDPNQAATDAYKEGYIVVTAHSIVNKVKLGVVGKLFKWFG
ncbi:hypothetical protein HOC35_04925 [Candidatus Woesearchaeota archaeon]|nr:hypothetical protein [Candidatus Woesearchaeota archaeon]